MASRENRNPRARLEGGSQKQTYDRAYRGEQRVRRLLRFDVRYRITRLHEVLQELDLSVEGAEVMDVGFGGGDILASFPASCHVSGVEISSSAVETAQKSNRFGKFRSAEFWLVREDDVGGLPHGPFDIIVCSHVLEHVDDDRGFVTALANRLKPGGTLFLFVPVEEPGYNPDHVRTYTLASIGQLATDSGLRLLFAEGSLHLNGHLWKLITVPSRRRWPVLGPLTNTLRLGVLALVPYRAMRWLEPRVAAMGLEPRQAFVVARRPSYPAPQKNTAAQTEGDSSEPLLKHGSSGGGGAPVRRAEVCGVSRAAGGPCR
jgi:SAM-dependent methyltransferase